MPRTSDARQRMVESAALLFREHGVQGTSFAAVLEHSGAPRGSIYHHFGEGKAQLAEAATDWAGEFMAAAIVAALREHEPVEAVGVFARRWTKLLEQTDFAAGCTIVAATLEGEREPAVRASAARAFASWQDALAAGLRAHGVPAARARSLAVLVVAAVEGAVILARAQRSTRPLREVTTELQAAVAAALC